MGSGLSEIKLNLKFKFEMNNSWSVSWTEVCVVLAQKRLAYQMFTKNLEPTVTRCVLVSKKKLGIYNQNLHIMILTLCIFMVLGRTFIEW